MNYKGNDLADPTTGRCVVRVGLCQTLSREVGRFRTGIAPRSQVGLVTQRGGK